MSLFRHKTTGEQYRVLHHAIECTNARVTYSSQPSVVVYCCASEGLQDMVFVRDLSEFNEKFEEIKESGPEQDKDS